MNRLVNEHRFAAMGTRVHVVVVGGPAELALRAGHRIDQLEQAWSRFRADSEISRLNTAGGRPVEVGHETWVLLSKACQAWRLSQGAFDPTVLEAMEANGYDRSFGQLGASPATTPRTPVRGAGCAGIELDDRRRSVRLPAGVGIDPGGIGKGLAADMVAAEMMRSGASGVLVNIGGDLVALGEPPAGEHWVVEIDEATICPVPLCAVRIERGGLATSVTTRRRWASSDGDRHHLVDPATGESTPGPTVLVSALACEGWVAEVTTKAHMVGRVSPALGSVPALTLDTEGRMESHAGFHEHLVGVEMPGPDEAENAEENDVEEEAEAVAS